MESKELVKQFRLAAWRDPQEARQFVADAGVLPAAELLKLLEILTSKQLGGDLITHNNRCAAFAKLGDGVADPELFVPYVRALRVPDPQVRAVLAALIPKVNNVSAHGELCQHLASQEQPLRELCAQLLRKIGGKAVFDAVAELVRRPEFPGRLEAVEVLSALGRHHAVAALGTVLQVGSPVEKASALRQLGDPRVMARDVPGALAAIAPALDSPMERVAVHAIAAYSALCSEDEFFQVIGPRVDSPQLGAARAAIDGMKRFASPRVLDALARKMRSGPNPLRLAVLGALEAIANDSVLPILVEALNHRQITVRNRAAEVLSGLSLSGKVDLARTILWLLRSRDVNVRRIAVDIAQKVGDPTGELGPKLLHLLRDEDWWVRERVMDALVEMAGKALTRHLVAYLADPSDVVRRFGIDALMRLKDPAALGALVRSAQHDGDWWVRERAIEAVAELGDPRAVPYLVDIMTREEEPRLACLGALATLRAAAAAPQVALLLGDDDPGVRRAALGYFAALNEPRHEPMVRPALDDADAAVRATARELLARWNLSTGGGAARADVSALDRLLLAVVQAGGDDLILSPGRRPMMKRLGKVVPLADALLAAEAIEAMLRAHLSPQQEADLAELRDVDFSHEVRSERRRFRANVFRQVGGLAAVFRTISSEIRDLEELGLPPAVRAFGDLKNGLVLIGGPTGSGKSTTLAALIDYINRTSARHIITLEDPIEVVHTPKGCLVNQREIGTHTRSFAAALRSTLRDDPDVILVGEMRDLATISFAVSAAETGHLVFGTLHTVSADTSVDRLIHVFPSAQQPQVRSMLAETLRAVACQYLLRRKDRPGERVLALEVMLHNDAIANMIRKGKTFQIPSVIATSRDAGMQSMDSDLHRLYQEGKVEAEEVYMKAANKKLFEGIVGDGDSKPPPRTATHLP